MQVTFNIKYFYEYCSKKLPKIQKNFDINEGSLIIQLLELRSELLNSVWQLKIALTYYVSNICGAVFNFSA
jgi:hypothetical protein